MNAEKQLQLFKPNYYDILAKEIELSKKAAKQPPAKPANPSHP